ncbi:sensor histidine kinase [Teichococcus aestuarii]|uniref:histidine kinase n=1 Tax=Teichococcus aestuarii TaxID=568898 RepID=A0A2U1V4K5_9PROT|nr:sensor histidine kinase [Pseudoroseomonas aestuarii]PWC28824.1 hypothetical protein CR165_09445 [Pseudoroseomonas aestuarii]
MAVRSLRLSYLALAILLCAMAVALLHATTTDHQHRMAAAIVRQSAQTALHQVEARLGRELEVAVMAATSGARLPALTKDKPSKDAPVPLELLRRQGWLGVQVSGPDGLLWRVAHDEFALWAPDPEGEARAASLHQPMASSLRRARSGLGAHLLLHAPLPVEEGGGVVTIVVPAALVEQALRDQLHMPGLHHRVLDHAGQDIASRPPVQPGEAGEPAEGTLSPITLTGPLTGWRIVTTVVGSLTEWMPRPSLLTLVMGVALAAALVLVCVLAYQTRRGQAAQEMLTRALAEQEAERRLSDIAANLPGALYRIVRTPGGKLECPYMSDGLTTLMGEPSGTSPQAALQRGLAPETRARVEAALRHSADTLTPLLLEFDFTTADGRRLWLRSMASAHPGVDGSVIWDGVLLDSTVQREAEERATLLAREVDHRAKNIMAVVRSLLLLTPRNVPPAQFVANLDGRLCAMARAHDLLAGQGWAGAELESVVRRELATYEDAGGAPRLVWHGPAVRLTPGSVQPVEMILHELSTNAAKHGALSRTEGMVEVRWLAVAQGGLMLDWRESGGPEVQGEPGRQGFGFRLIHTLARHQLGGGATFLWSPTGLHCRIRLGAASIAAIETFSEPPLPADSPLEIPEPPARQAAMVM